MTPVDQLIIKNLNELSESGVEVAYNKLQELRNKLKTKSKVDITEDQRMEQWVIDRVNSNIKS
jgi:hypothetical protein